MRVERFGEFKTGQLLPITVDDRRSDFAFLPDDLPPAWEPDTTIWPLIAEARARFESLNGVGKYLPNPSLLLRTLQRREAITSNSIEGTYVNPQELLLYEAEKQSRDPKSEKENDQREVWLYDSAMTEGCERIAEGQEIDRAMICDLHHLLLSTTRGKNESPGVFRDCQVYVSTRFIPPPADRLDELFSNLEQYLNSTHGDPLVRAFIAHYQFETIHPFRDGNGRMGRLLLSLCVYKWLNHNHAWLYLSAFFDKNKEEYYAKLFAVSAHGEWDEWVRFCLAGTIEQAEAAERRCSKLVKLKATYETEFVQTTPRMAKIATILLSSPFTTRTRLAQELGVSYQTAKADIQKLCAAGVLSELNADGKEQVYYSQEIYRIAYGD